MKRLLALLLCVITIVIGLPFSASAAKEAYPEKAVDVAAEGMTTINAVEHALWYENHLEADQHKGDMHVEDYKDGGQIIKDMRIGDSVTYRINIQKAGTYYLSVFFIWGWNTLLTFSIDDGDPIEMHVGAFVDWDTASKDGMLEHRFTKGEHTVKITHALEGSGCHFYALNLAYAPSSSLTPLSVEDDGLGFRAKINADFSSFSCKFAAGRDAYSSCRFTLYKWDETFEKTVKGKACASKTIRGVADGNVITVDVGKQEAGEYLFVFYAGKRCGVWVDISPIEPHGFLYVDGEEHVAELDIKINTVGEVDGELFGKCEPQPIESASENTTEIAPETTSPETTAPETTATETTGAPVADTTAAPAEESTAAPAADTTAAAGTKAPEATTEAETSGGCGSVVASVSAIALVAVASAAAVALKKKEN